MNWFKLAQNNPLLRNKPYLALMSSQLIANLGEWIYLLALLNLVGLKWLASPLEITALMLCMVIPMLVGGPLAGMLADKIDRKKLMILSDIARVVIVLGLVLASEMAQVYALLIAKSLFDVLFSPAKNGKLKEIVPSEHLEQAVSYSAIIEQGSKILGPALGGLLTAAFGITACFMINSGAFMISAIILVLVPGKLVKPDILSSDSSIATEPAIKTTFWNEFTAGIRIIAGIPVIAWGLLTLAIVLLVLQIADSQLIVLFRDLPNMDESLLGWCIALSGFGTLTAAVLIRMLREWSLLAKMGSGGAVMGLVFAGAAALTLYGPFNSFGHFLMIGAFFVAGLGAGATFIPFQVTLQQRTPEQYTGRVFGTVTSVMSTASVIGPLCGGFLVTAFGAPLAFFLSGGIMFMIAIVLLLFKNSIMQRREHIPANQTETA
ncbi:MAG: MFS transporter [Candidatus Pristimantibacillus sp.]